MPICVCALSRDVPLVPFHVAAISRLLASPTPLSPLYVLDTVATGPYQIHAYFVDDDGLLDTAVDGAVRLHAQRTAADASGLHLPYHGLYISSALRAAYIPPSRGARTGPASILPILA